MNLKDVQKLKADMNLHVWLLIADYILHKRISHLKLLIQKFSVKMSHKNVEKLFMLIHILTILNTLILFQTAMLFLYKYAFYILTCPPV